MSNNADLAEFVSFFVPCWRRFVPCWRKNAFFLHVGSAALYLSLRRMFLPLAEILSLEKRLIRSNGEEYVIRQRLERISEDYGSP